MGIIINHYKDPYWNNQDSMESSKAFFRGSSEPTPGVSGVTFREITWNLKMMEIPALKLF